MRCPVRRFLFLVIGLGALAAPFAPAKGGEALDDRALFVIGNTLFTVYHELGHALIDLLDLPVIGREEDAVDGFAAVTMIPSEPDAVRDALIVAVADGWRLQSDAGYGGGGPVYWGEHALDEQRHFAIVCLMVGSDQEGFYDFALEAGLPDERIDSCQDDFARMDKGWRRVLAPHRSSPEATGAPAPRSIDVAFEEPAASHRDLETLIRRRGVLENAIDRFAGGVALPSSIGIRFASCDDANAYWSKSEGEVTVCYELIEEFDEILRKTVLH